MDTCHIPIRLLGQDFLAVFGAVSKSVAQWKLPVTRLVINDWRNEQRIAATLQECAGARRRRSTNRKFDYVPENSLRRRARCAGVRLWQGWIVPLIGRPSSRTDPCCTESCVDQWCIKGRATIECIHLASTSRWWCYYRSISGAWQIKFPGQPEFWSANDFLAAEIGCHDVSRKLIPLLSPFYMGVRGQPKGVDGVSLERYYTMWTTFTALPLPAEIVSPSYSILKDLSHPICSRPGKMVHVYVVVSKGNRQTG